MVLETLTMEERKKVRELDQRRAAALTSLMPTPAWLHWKERRHSYIDHASFNAGPCLQSTATHAKPLEVKHDQQIRYTQR